MKRKTRSRKKVDPSPNLFSCLFAMALFFAFGTGVFYAFWLHLKNDLDARELYCQPKADTNLSLRYAAVSSGVDRHARQIDVKSLGNGEIHPVRSRGSEAALSPTHHAFTQLPIHGGHAKPAGTWTQDMEEGRGFE